MTIAHPLGTAVQPCWVLTSHGTAVATTEHTAQNVLGTATFGDTASRYRSLRVQEPSVATGSHQEGSKLRAMLAMSLNWQLVEVPNEAVRGQKHSVCVCRS